MKVLNIHKRIIQQPIAPIAALLKTLASPNDQIWPTEQWPRMKLNNGLNVDSTGGHGPIHYRVQTYLPNQLVEFKFIAPKAFKGTHKFELIELAPNQTIIQHSLDMKVTGIGILTWSIGIRWLHDALIEDAFDKVENQFLETPKKTSWNLWVRLLRKAL
ncbi:SRPBCC family protein [Aureispira anguillae]|uniref:SRPBCC family protein n=1 Tax=Aureispira anguillae TaxID=2864201 RepID=A0A915YKG2_9BACT|nr:hypothetical protein [Aureispira anguillae]BDS14730.1 hypothetical protein AsAng_0055120 [Aureispira anguillae]